MKSISSFLVGGVATCLLLVASFAQAGIRDAGAKARGEYGTPFISNDYRSSNARYSAPQRADVSSAVVNNDRSYSYDSATRRSASANSAQVARQPATSARRFSYEPNTANQPLRTLGRVPSTTTPHNYSGGARDAASKILGQY